MQVIDGMNDATDYVRIPKDELGPIPSRSIKIIRKYFEQIIKKHERKDAN